MIGLDTNILIRYITQDDPVQSRKATEIIEHLLSEANPGFLSVLAVAEAVWVLDRAYGLSAGEIAAAIERVLQVEVFVVENEQEVFRATMALKQRHGPFADALIAELGIRAGCTHTFTFDKKQLAFQGSSSLNAILPDGYAFPGFRFSDHPITAITRSPDLSIPSPRSDQPLS